MYVVMNSERVRSLREEKGLSKRGLAAGASGRSVLSEVGCLCTFVDATRRRCGAASEAT